MRGGAINDFVPAQLGLKLVVGFELEVSNEIKPESR